MDSMTAEGNEPGVAMTRVLSDSDQGSSVLKDSEALRRNLEETAVGDVRIDPRYRVLQEVVEDYRDCATQWTRSFSS